MSVYVLVPPPAYYRAYRLPAILYADKAVFVYRSVNESYFTVNITLYNVKFDDIFFFTTRQFNITVTFLVNKETLTAKYWNGKRWIDAGVLPIAAPDIYVHVIFGYSSRGVLSGDNAVTGNSSRASGGGVPSNMTRLIVGKHEFKYLGMDYVLYPVQASAESRTIRLAIDSYEWVSVKIVPPVPAVREAIIKAASDYLAFGNIDALEKIIISNDAFIKYESVGHSGGTATIIPILKDGVFPSINDYLVMPLPVDGMRGLPGDLAGEAAIAILDIENSKAAAPTNYSVSLLPRDSKGCSGCVITAIDARLAVEWLDFTGPAEASPSPSNPQQPQASEGPAYSRETATTPPTTSQQAKENTATSTNSPLPRETPTTPPIEQAHNQEAPHQLLPAAALLAALTLAVLVWAARHTQQAP